MKFRTIAKAALLSIAVLTPFTHAGLISGNGSPIDHTALTGSVLIDFSTLNNGLFNSSNLDTNLSVTADSGKHFYLTDYDYAANYGGNSYNSAGRYIENAMDYASTRAFNFLFGIEVSAFGFNFGASDEDWKLEAFDKNFNLLESYILPRVESSNAWEYFGIERDNMFSVRLTQVTEELLDTDHVLIDNLAYKVQTTASVSEPNAMILLLLALTGLGLARSQLLHPRNIR